MTDGKKPEPPPPPPSPRPVEKPTIPVRTYSIKSGVDDKPISKKEG